MKQLLQIAVCGWFLGGMGFGMQAQPLHRIPCRNAQQVEHYFAYRPGHQIISGHRGGMTDGYPENCIETFENTLRAMPSFFEIDPRMTRDSVLVLMHDATLDRTTTGRGAVSDYTYEELLQFNLVDRWGKETSFKIPRVSDVIRWSRGKTILNFDQKDVPREILMQLVQSMKARNVIYTIHSPQEAVACCALDPEAHFSAWMRNMEDFRAYEATGIPWSRFIVYVVSSRMQDAQRELYEALHQNGVRCMVSTAPDQDRIADAAQRQAAYREVVAEQPDIIETDFPLEFLGLK
ncbi:MAG: glycerophosphodiester phosphodiesterase family protein [Alistipes sp.]|nr:glycerophosphodiester phosphodiesterase family protein [Alistipes sp.]